MHARKVVWIEPDPKCLRALHALLSANAPSAEVIPLVGVLQEADAVTSPVRCQGMSGNAAEGGQRSFNVGEILSRHDMDPLSLLKMDIEGAEFGVLRSSGDWIGRLENLAMEVHRRAGDPAEIVAFLANKEFEVLTTDSDLQPCPPSRADYIYASRTGALLDRAGRRARQ